MKIKLNGETHEAGNAGNISELVSTLTVPAQALLVEHNGVALRKDEWSERRLQEGDVVEMIRIVAGG